jgi:hypothetical protein
VLVAAPPELATAVPAPPNGSPDAEGLLEQLTSAMPMQQA